MSEDVNPEVVIYNSGLVYCSVCTSLKDVTELTKRVNGMNPTGIKPAWKIADEYFRGGKSNPCVCNTNPNRLHYLFSC